MEEDGLHLRLNHLIGRGILYRRRWGSIFIKGVKGFEVKKAFNPELEVLVIEEGEKKERWRKKIVKEERKVGQKSKAKIG